VREPAGDLVSQPFASFREGGAFFRAKLRQLATASRAPRSFLAMARLASSRLALLAASAAAAASSGAASSAAPPAQVFTLHLLDAAAFPMAQCLDGSVGGFYFQPGSGSGATQWMVHTQG
jgi:hypothetical protein